MNKTIGRNIFILDKYSKMKITSRTLSEAKANSNVINLRTIAKENNYKK